MTYAEKLKDPRWQRYTLARTHPRLIAAACSLIGTLDAYCLESRDETYVHVRDSYIKLSRQKGA